MHGQKNIKRCILFDIPIEAQEEKKELSEREVSPKRRYVSVNLHGVMSHYTVIYTIAVSKTANLAMKQIPRYKVIYTY